MSNAAPVRFSRRRLLRVCTLCSPGLALVVTPPSVFAIDRDWVGTGPLLFWDTAGNWNPADTPGPFDAVTLDLDLAGTPIIAGVASNASSANFRGFDYEITGAAGGTLNVFDLTRINDGSAVTASNGLAWTHTGSELDGDLYLGGAGSDAQDTGDGTLHVIDNSSVQARRVYLGEAAGTTGTAIVGGPGTGGAPSTSALLQTTGGGSEDGFYLGYSGTGILNVLPGGTARMRNDTFGGVADFELGFAATGVGTLNIIGPGATVVAEDVIFGRFGSATVNVTNGGNLIQNIFPTSADAFIANDPGSSANILVAGAGSAWAMNRMELGGQGNATLSIHDGGTVTNYSTNDIVIGVAAGGAGTLAVVGTPESAVGAGDPRISTVNAGRDVYVGDLGHGQLRIGIGLDADLSTSPVGPGHAAFNVTNAGGDFTIGDDTGNDSDSLVYVTGPNAALNINDILFIGDAGNGRMIVNGGATVSSARPRVASGVNTVGALTVDGVGSSFTATLDMTVGTNGNATAVVSNGATLTTADYLAVGFQGGSVGDLTIDGPGSVVNVATNNTGDLYVGGSSFAAGGTGTLTITNGGRLNVSDEGLIGGNATGTGTVIVTGRDSLYLHDDGALNDDLNVGFAGDGFMRILDGGQAVTERVIIGNEANIANADLLVSGVNVQPGQPDAASQLTVAGWLWIGDTSRGTMTIADGGRVRVGERFAVDPANTRLIVGDENPADGSSLTITGPGSRLDFFGTADIAVGNAGGSTANRALLDINNGGVLSAVQRDAQQAVTNSARVIVGDIDNGNGQINVAGPGSRLEASVLYVGDGNTNSSGLVNLTNGGIIDLLDEMQIGSNGNGVGIVNVGGLDNQAQPFANVSVLNVGEDLELGSDLPNDGAANGTLNVRANGQVNVAGNTFVGHYTGSFGTLSLGGLTDAPAEMNVAGNLIVAGTETSSQTGAGSGTLNVNANATLIINGNFRVRDRGTVHLNGGELTFESLTLNTTDGNALTNPTFNWNAGTVRYDNPGTVSLNDINLDFLLGDTGLGSVNVATLVAGQTLAVESSNPADPGAALFDVPLRLNGGTLRVDAVAGNNFANVDWDAGTVELLRSNLTVGTTGLLGRTVALGGDQRLRVNQAVTVQADGTLAITGDAAASQTNANFSAGALNNFGLAVFTSTAVNVNTDNVGNGLVNNGRVVLIDADLTGPVVNLGSITLVGDSSINAASFSNGAATTLEISLDPAQTAAPVVDVANTATLAGILDLDHRDTNFALPPGFTMTLLEAAEIVGTFDRITGTSLSPTEALAVTYTPGAVRITRAIAGDANLSGAVEQGDLDAVLTNWGGAGRTWASGDFNGNGTVEQGDLDAVLTNWGSAATPDFRGVAVPEPATLGWLTLTALTLRRRR